jgi:acyl dehydratase
MTAITAATIDGRIVGTEVGPIVHAIDARWLMAYAAALGEQDPRYFDTLAAAGPLAHPMFAVCYEWPAAVALREATTAAHLQSRSVHATHDLVIHRRPRAGDTLRTRARVIAVTPRRSGTLVVFRFETVDAEGEPVTTTDYGSVYRGVVMVARPGSASGTPARASAAPPAADGAAPAWTDTVEILPNAALVYTECARIWNPIHTDVAVARQAGLSGPILHGTATLALAVSRVVAHDLGGEPTRVRGIRARFTGMVALPSRLAVRGGGSAGAFDAVGADGGAILSEGAVET